MAMRPAMRVAAVLAVVMAVAAVAIVVLATTPWGNERVRRLIVSRANEQIVGAFSVSSVRGNLFTGATLTNVQLLDSLQHPVFAARRVEVKYGLLAALRGKVVIRRLVLDTPVVVLDKRPGSRWNFQTLMRPKGSSPRDSSSASLPPVIQDIVIRHGRFVYRRPWRPDTVLAADKRDEAIAAALGTNARKRTQRVPGGYQRVLDYRHINARIPDVKIDPRGTTSVQIAALSMLAEPYRPPSLDIRSLVGTLNASKDSLWWRDLRMSLPGSRISGDGTVGLRKNGFRLDLTGSPVALADLRWLDPRVSETGGGKFRYQMRIRGDTAEYGISGADLKYGAASISGEADIRRVKADGKRTELLVRGADVTVANLTTAAIRELVPKVKIRRDGTIDGRVVVSGEQSALKVDADVRFADARAGTSHLIARGGIGFADQLRLTDLAVQLRPLHVASLDGTGVKLPLGGVVSGDAVVSGTAREGWTVRGDLTHVERGARSRVAGSGRYQSLGKRIVADARLQPLSLVTVGRFAPGAQLRGSVTGRVHAEGTTRNLKVEGDLRAPNGGRIRGTGTVNPAGSRTRYDVAVVVDALNASAFSRRGPATRLTGTINARGVGTKPATMNTIFAVDLARSSYDTFSLERLRARGSVAAGLLRLDTLDAAERGARASAAGTFGLVPSRSGRLSLAVDVDSLGALRRWIGTRDTGVVGASRLRQSALLAAARADSARRAQAIRIEQMALGLPSGVALMVDTLPSIRRDSLAGTLSVRGTLSGHTKAMAAEGTATGTGLVVRGNAVRNLSVVASSPNVKAREAVITPTAEGVQIGRMAFDAIDGSVLWKDKTWSGGLRVRQDSLVSYVAQGAYTRPAKGTHDVRLDSVRAQFGQLVWRTPHPGRVRYSAALVELDSVELVSSAGGRLFANGRAPRDGAMRLDVAAENVRVATVLQAMQRDADGDGSIGFSAAFGGTRNDPTIVGKATLRDAMYKTTRAPDADVDLNYRARALALVATATDSTGRRVLAVTASLPIDLALAEVEGSRLIEGQLVADVKLDSLSLASLPIRSRTVEDIHGKLGADAHVRGTWKKPAYSGAAELRDAGLTLVYTGLRVDSAIASLRLSSDSLVLDSLVARAGGPLRARGSVDFADPKRPFIRASVSGKDVRVFNNARGLLDADADIIALGPLDELRVTGGGNMNGGYLNLKQFRKDLLRVKAPGDLNFFAVFDTSSVANDSLRVDVKKQKGRFGVIADLALTIDRGNYYLNRPDANAEFYTGEGEVVRAHLDTRTDEKWAVGFVRTGAAGITLFRTRAFTPVRGTMTFVPHTDAPAIVQNVGERVVWEPGRGLFPVHLITAGTSKAPSIGMESGSLFPIRGRELNSYLTMGRLTLSMLQQSGSSLSGSSGWSGQLGGETGALAHRQQGATALGVVLHSIGAGTTKEFAVDAFSVSPADLPTELVFGKTGGVRGALVEGGRYVTTERYIAGSIRLFTTSIPGLRLSQKFGTTYRLDVGVEPRFLFRGVEELGITHPTSRSGSFGAFLTRMWNF